MVDAFLLVPDGKGPFPAVVVVYYDAQTGVLTYVSAGHPPPILTHSTGAMERLTPASADTSPKRLPTFSNRTGIIDQKVTPRG